MNRGFELSCGSWKSEISSPSDSACWETHIFIHSIVGKQARELKTWDSQVSTGSRNTQTISGSRGVEPRKILRSSYRFENENSLKAKCKQAFKKGRGIARCHTFSLSLNRLAKNPKCPIWDVDSYGTFMRWNMFIPNAPTFGTYAIPRWLCRTASRTRSVALCVTSSFYFDKELVTVRGTMCHRYRYRARYSLGFKKYRIEIARDILSTRTNPDPKGATWLIGRPSGYIPITPCFRARSECSDFLFCPIYR